MKKFITLLAMVAVVGVAQAAYVWNVNWSLGGGWAYSPGNSDEDAGILDDYNVTWSLVDAGSGKTLAGAEMTAYKGGMLGFDDEANGGGKATYLSDLEIASGVSTWFGSDNDGATHNIYQRIFAWNDSEAFEWVSDTFEVKATDDTDVPLPTATKLFNGEIIIGTQGMHSEANTFWSTADLPSDVPEPATMSLLGLGALAMVIRRKLRK